MNMVYGEPVNVQARDDGRPARFVWRGRLYIVRVIEEHWVINREWWREPGTPQQPEEPREPGTPQQPEVPQPPEAPAARPGQPELEFWRVVASSGPGLAPGVYELRREIATGAWTLRPGQA